MQLRKDTFTKGGKNVFHKDSNRQGREYCTVKLIFVHRYGFIVMDGNGSLFGALCGNSREVITKFTVDLPKKHGRGGQSALRFARLRLEKRHNYVRKVDCIQKTLLFPLITFSST